MTVKFESGYSLPGGDLPLKHARVLHANNQMRIRKAAAFEAAAGFGPDAVKNWLTYEVWRPFENELSADDEADLSTSSWTLVGLDLESDNKTLVEDMSTGSHQARYDTPTWQAVETVVAVKISRPENSKTNVRVTAFDGSTSYTGFFDIESVTAGASASANSAEIIDLGNDTYWLKVIFTPAAGTAGSIFIQFVTGGSTSYTGDGGSDLKVEKVVHHVSNANLFLDTYQEDEIDVVAFAAHNFGSSGTSVQLNYDSTGIGTFTTETDEPLMIFFSPRTSNDWRILVSGGVLPEIGVVRLGKALQMERPFYGGFTPTIGRRNTVAVGTLSESGQWLGRNILREGYSAEYSWDNLSESWVRANILGQGGMQQALERYPFFIAWRPGEQDDVDYGWVAESPPGPSHSGPRDLMSWSFSAEVYGWDNRRERV